MRPALIVIDMQKYFLDENPKPFQEKLLRNISTLLSLMRSSGVPVIHVITRYSKGKSDWPEAWKHRDSIWCLEDTEGVQILEEVRPLAGERIVVKTRFSGFYNSELDSVLRSLHADTLFIAGYSSDVCVRMTTMDAYNRDYRLFLLADCTYAAGEDTEASFQYLQRLTNLAVVSIKEVKEILQELD